MKGGWRLQIEADNKRLEKKLCNIENLKKTIGIDMTRALKLRIDQLRAADNFKEYLDIGLGDPHPLVGNLDNFFGIKINRNYRLIVEPLSENFVRKGSESNRLLLRLRIANRRLKKILKKSDKN